MTIPGQAPRGVFPHSGGRPVSNDFKDNDHVDETVGRAGDDRWPGRYGLCPDPEGRAGGFRLLLPGFAVLLPRLAVLRRLLRGEGGLLRRRARLLQVTCIDPAARGLSPGGL
jgi:hypothetical protein